MANPLVNVHGSCGNISLHIRNCASTGRPVLIKAVDNAGLAADACAIVKQFNVRSTIIMRFVDFPGYPQGIPNYQREPKEEGRNIAAAAISRVHQAPELLPHIGSFYISIFNEIRTKYDPDNPNYENMHPLSWIAVCGKAAAEILLAAGYKVSLFSFNAGEPEPNDWKLPEVIEFLVFAAAFKDRVLIDFHEGFPIGAGLNDDWNSYWPHMIGRFGFMYSVCRQFNIPFPSVVISEFAWKNDDMPDGTQALKVVGEVLSEVYQTWPDFQALFLWTGNFPGVNARIRDKMCAFATTSLWNYALTGDVPVTDPELPQDCFGKPRVDYSRIYVLLHPDLPKTYAVRAADATYELRGTPKSGRYTIGYSADDAAVADLTKRIVIAVNPAMWGPGDDGTGLAGFFKQYYPGTVYQPVVVTSAQQLFDMLEVYDPNNPPVIEPITFSSPVGTQAERDAGELWN